MLGRGIGLSRVRVIARAIPRARIRARFKC
jgi:hypothetical protein